MRISVYLLYWAENQTTDVKYEVHCGDTVHEFHFDMTKLTENTWVTLGTFDFDGSGSEFVRVVGTGVGDEKTNTRASTVAFEIINTANGNVWQTVYVTSSQVQSELHNDETFEAEQSKIFEKFTDTLTHWANYDICYVVNEGLMTGVTDTTFNPDSTISRNEMLSIITGALNNSASEAGLLEGLPEGWTADSSPITLEDLSVLFYNAAKLTGKNDEWISDLLDDVDSFINMDNVSSYANDAVRYLGRADILQADITGGTVGSMSASVTRAQAAVVLKRFMSAYVWAGPPTDEEWVMTFNDEFLGDSLDWDVWESQDAWPSHILSYRSPDNAVVEDGSLKLVVKKESKGGAEWTSGNVWVDPTVFRQSYGYWEARYKITAAKGINNSFWAITKNVAGLVSETNQHFELDINEGKYQNKVHTNYHSYYTGEKVEHSEAYTAEYDLSKDFHTYALEWNENELIYYFDGEVIAVKANENASIPVFPYLSTAVLNWAGLITDQADGTAQVIDYVRIYQRAEDANDPNKVLIGQPIVQGGGSNTEPENPGGGGSTEPETPSEPEETIPVVSIYEQSVDNTVYENEIIIPCELEGNWKASTAITNYNNGEHYWSATEGAISKYTLTNIPAGEYKVYFWRLPHKNNTQQMNFTLVQGSTSSHFGSVAIKCADGDTIEPGWILMDTITLNNGEDTYLENVCEGINCRASAMKLVPVQNNGNDTDTDNDANIDSEDPEEVTPEIITEGTVTSYTKDSNAAVSVHCTGELNKLTVVKMDNQEVDEANYTVKEGSTIVTFKAEYLNGLSEGEHTVTLVYEEGRSVDSKLTISANLANGDVNQDTDNAQGDDTSGEDDSSVAEDATDSLPTNITVASSPSTGDDSNLMLWLILLACAVLMCGFIALNVKRVKNRL